MPPVTTLPTLDVMGTAEAQGSFRMFAVAARNAGLLSQLRGRGPFTVFMPTDQAFGDLPSGWLETMYRSENREELAAILNYHIIIGRRTVWDLRKGEKARTLCGEHLTIVHHRGNVSVDGANVTSHDMLSTNGVLHAVDKVNIPRKKY